MARYPFTCEECGREGTFTAKHQFRHHPYLCLGCVRRRNGWEHAADCAQAPDHRGACEAARTTRIVVPPRFAEDWMDACGGDTVNAAKDPVGTKVEVVKRTTKALTLDVGPVALDDLIARAAYYVIEEYDEPYLRGLQASARATLRRLAEAGVARQVGRDWRMVLTG